MREARAGGPMCKRCMGRPALHSRHRGANATTTDDADVILAIHRPITEMTT